MLGIGGSPKAGEKTEHKSETREDGDMVVTKEEIKTEKTMPKNGQSPGIGPRPTHTGGSSSAPMSRGSHSDGDGNRGGRRDNF